MRSFLDFFNNKFIFFALIFFSAPTFSQEILTNCCLLRDSPKWVTPGRVNRIADSIQSKMEWSIRRIKVVWHKEQASFQNSHTLGPWPIAVSKKAENVVHMGPKITHENFDSVFGHELVHIISFQKYKEAIPKWLEEGMANFLAKAGQVDYKWLSDQKRPAEVRSLIHPADGSRESVKYHYMASQALVEMIAAKCDLRNLMRLSVGRTMDSYLMTYCEIKDLNQAFDKWLVLKGTRQ